ncbi:MAG: hypothetical protein E7581_00920 [Ruminococcaceae bacterium]|nr:hypothetical protein [Oscillospiraceae bacterium]
MQNKPRKHMGIGLIAVSMLFLWNPDALAVFDLLPDVIGYILLSLGMSSLSYLNHHFDQSAKYFNRMIALSAARLVFVLVLFGLVSHFERPTTILLGNFVFGVLELMALLPGYKHMFEGFLYAGSRSGNGKSVYLMRVISPLTRIFVITKVVLSVLPELTVLAETEGGYASIYDFVNLFRAASMLLGGVIGLVWLVLVLVYFIGILKDKPYVQALHDHYMREIYPNTDLFVAKRYKLGSFFLLLGVLLTLDLPMENVNVLPDVLSAICLIAGILVLRHYVTSYKPCVLVLCAYGAVSVLDTFWQYRYFNVEKFTAQAALRGGEATGAYVVSIVISVVCAIVFVMAMVGVLSCLKSMIRSHTGYTVSHVDMQSYGKLNALHKQLIRGLTPVLVMTVVCALGSIVYTLTLPLAGKGGEWYTIFASVVWLINLVLGTVLVILFVEKNGDIMEQINNRYLLTTPAAPKEDAE